MERLNEIAKILRIYTMFEDIDFVNRSQAAKGTINWSEYVAKFLLEQDPKLK